MKIATFIHNNARNVGIVDDDSATVAPFELCADRAQLGIQTLIELQVAGSELPATTTPVPLDQVEFEAPLPRPNRQDFPTQ